jgi:CRP-like cAMP-binding protein
MNQKILDKLNEYFSQGEEIKYAKGTILTFANEEPEGVSFLLDGTVEQYDITPEGNKITVNIFKPPAFFPMSWAINRVPNTYYYAAASVVRLRRANTDNTVAFLQANPDVMFDLLSRLYKGTDALLKRLVLTSSGMASNRLIFELLIEAYRFGIDTNGPKRLISIRQNVLAARCGLARETVSRELHKLENNNSLSLSKQGIIIDIAKLERLLSSNT